MSLLDWARVVVVSVACVCMVLMSLRAHRARVIKGDRFTVFATSALVMAMLFVVVAEVQQVGHPLRTWWGLPMLAVITLLTLAALWRSDV